MRLVTSLSYEGVLERGFALVRDAEDRPLKRASEVKTGEALRLQFADGSTGAIATGKPSGGTTRKTAPAQKEPGKQGSLF
jgi:exodeoxyribonuclease VII large subunit